MPLNFKSHLVKLIQIALSFKNACRPENLEILSDYCDEFLVHGVDVEGKKCGIEEELVILLGQSCRLPVTYGKYSTVYRIRYHVEFFNTSHLI